MSTPHQTKRASSFVLKGLDKSNPDLIETNARTAYELKRVLSGIQKEHARIKGLFKKTTPGSATEEQLQALQRLTVLALDTQIALPRLQSIVEATVSKTNKPVLKQFSQLPSRFVKEALKFQSRFAVNTLPSPLKELTGLHVEKAKILSFTKELAVLYIEQGSKTAIITGSKGKYYLNIFSNTHIRPVGSYYLGKSYKPDQILSMLKTKR